MIRSVKQLGELTDVVLSLAEAGNLTDCHDSYRRTNSDDAHRFVPEPSYNQTLPVKLSGRLLSEMQVQSQALSTKSK